MKKFHFVQARVAWSVVFVLVLLSGLSCSNYDYSSPTPGVIEVHLRTISNNIPYLAVNNFILNLNQLEAIRSDGARVEVFSDLRANQRVFSAAYNLLDPRARDSSLVLGQVYAPPSDYSSLYIDISPSDSILLNGYQGVGVELPAGSITGTLPTPFSLSESTGKKIVVVINLDSALVKGAQNFNFRPYIYISSITSF